MPYAVAALFDKDTVSVDWASATLTACQVLRSTNHISWWTCDVLKPYQRACCACCYTQNNRRAFNFRCTDVAPLSKTNRCLCTNESGTVCAQNLQCVRHDRIRQARLVPAAAFPTEKLQEVRCYDTADSRELRAATCTAPAGNSGARSHATTPAVGHCSSRCGHT